MIKITAVFMLSIIRFFEKPMIGPIEPWVFLVLCGCALGVYLFIRRCALHGLDGMLFSRVGTWILIWSFACARASHVFLYRWEAYRDHPLDMFKIWEGGFLSYGGFFGAAIVVIYYARQHWINFWPLADAGIYAFMCGWTIGLSDYRSNRVFFGS